MLTHPEKCPKCESRLVAECGVEAVFACGTRHIISRASGVEEWMLLQSTECTLKAAEKTIKEMPEHDPELDFTENELEIIKACEPREGDLFQDAVVRVNRLIDKQAGWDLDSSVHVSVLAEIIYKYAKRARVMSRMLGTEE